MIKADSNNNERLFIQSKKRFGFADKSGITYTAVNFLVYGLYFLRALLVPKILDSYSFGIFSMFNLYLKFSTVFDLGSISYLQKEVALTSHQKLKHDKRLEQQVIFLNVFLVFVSTLFFFLFNWDIVGKVQYLDYIIWLAIAIFSQLYIIKTGVLRSLGEFKVLTKVILANALMSFVIVFFYLFGIKNIYLIYSVYLLSVFIPVGTYFYKEKKISLWPLKFLSHTWPIFLYNILFYLYVNIDKFIVKESFTFLEFSTYSLYSTISASVFMAISLLWGMFYSKIFEKSNIAEKLDTVNTLIILICLCTLKLLFPFVHNLFPDYVERIQFYNVSILYAAFVFYLPNSLIKYLNNKRALLMLSSVLCLHIISVFSLNYFGRFLNTVPFLSWVTYLFIEIIGIKENSKKLFFVRASISVLILWLCLN